MSKNSNQPSAKSKSNHPSSVVASYSGPIPPAQQMEDYAKIDSSLPERIMKLAENESKHFRRAQKMRNEG